MNMLLVSVLSVFIITLSSCASFSSNNSEQANKRGGIVVNDVELDVLINNCQTDFISDCIDNDIINTFICVDNNGDRTRAISLSAYDPNPDDMDVGVGNKLKYLFFVYLHSDDNETSANNALRLFNVDIVAIMEYIEIEEEKNKSLDVPPKFTRILLNFGFYHHGIPDKLWHVFYNASKMDLKELHTILSEGFYKKSGG